MKLLFISILLLFSFTAFSQRVSVAKTSTTDSIIFKLNNEELFDYEFVLDGEIVKRIDSFKGVRRFSIKLPEPIHGVASREKGNTVRIILARSVADIRREDYTNLIEL